MGRRIVTTQVQSAGGESVDGFSARIVKYIPADIVAAWIALLALLPAGVPNRRLLLWLCFAGLLVLTPFWMMRVTRSAALPVARTQVIVSTVAFAVWVFATGLPFSAYSFYHPAVGGIALIFFTLVSGVIDPATFARTGPVSIPQQTGGQEGLEADTTRVDDGVRGPDHQ